MVGLEKRSKALKLSTVLALLCVIGIIDYLTGYEFAFSLFYVLPISLATWLTSRRFGLMASLASALAWLGADVAAGHPYSHPLIPIWNTLIRLGFFALITVLLAALRRAAQREKELARTDALTSAVNLRFFYELLQMEIDRAQRYQHPFTLVYIDLDNFKAVNDQQGHPMGDAVLRTVVDHARKQLRKMDVVARLGGDEFALLLPETGQEAARAALTKLQDGLLGEMRRNSWPITFSIGALTCSTPLSSTAELVRMADELLYSVKHGTKNAIRYSTYTGEGQLASE
jgi:diguanylate cyclase (GGDEF)-like protein